LQLNISIAEVVAELMTHFQGEVLTNNEVTQIVVQENQGLVQTNGSDVYTADRVYFFESAAKLGKIIPTESLAFPKAAVQKLSKSQNWAIVNLAYWHKTELTETRATHILYGAKDLPCIGAFSKTQGQAIVSQWMSILSAESFADTEQLGLTIREMKKQIKRMYPTFFDSIEKEYIVVAPESLGAAPQAVVDNPDIFKNQILFLGSQHYAMDMALAGDASSYLKLRPFFLSGTATQEPTPT
jgi:phytoene dehydrogenase-like protein